MTKFNTSGIYYHKRCLDVGIRVIKVQFITEARTKLRVEWVYKDPRRGALGIVENIIVKREDMPNWAKG